MPTRRQACSSVIPLAINFPTSRVWERVMVAGRPTGRLGEWISNCEEIDSCMPHSTHETEILNAATLGRSCPKVYGQGSKADSDDSLGKRYIFLPVLAVSVSSAMLPLG